MCLIKCKICKKEISSNAISCPNCGEPLKKEIKEDNELYNVVLINKGNSYIKVVQKLREITGCSLKEAKDSIDYVPSIIIKNIDQLKAIEYKRLFEDLGAIIDIISVDNSQNINNYIFKDTLTNKLIIKCTNCGSTNTHKISGASKVGSAILFGIFSMGKITKTYECDKCGYKW